MKKKYTSGDIFTIPLENGKYAICQIIWAPTGDYKNVFSFCTLETGNHSPSRETDETSPLLLNDDERTVEVIFSGTKNITSGKWAVIGHEDLSGRSKKLMTFNIAGSLHEGDTFIRKLTPNEYTIHPSMSVFGFELIQDILINNI